MIQRGSVPENFEQLADSQFFQSHDHDTRDGLTAEQTEKINIIIMEQEAHNKAFIFPFNDSSLEEHN